MPDTPVALRRLAFKVSAMRAARAALWLLALSPCVSLPAFAQATSASSGTASAQAGGSGVPAVTRLPSQRPETTGAQAGTAPAASVPTAPLAPATVPMPGMPHERSDRLGPGNPSRLGDSQIVEPLPEPSEFERLVTQVNGGVPVWRLGARQRRIEDMLVDRTIPARVPPHYVIQVGDELTVSTWGSVDAQWLLRVDRAGRVVLPRVGPVAVAGETAGGLEARLRTRLSQVFKNFELAAAVTDLSPVRVHITGFVERAGDYIVPGLTTISGALSSAQGPAAGGSFRRIRLQRDDKTVVVFDSYALLSDGRRREDLLLQPGDVLFVEPVGPQAAVLGSVNRPAVFEFLPGETVADLLRLAGGFSSVANRDGLMSERLSDRIDTGAIALRLPGDAQRPVVDGDILRARSQVAAAAPSQQRNKRVLVEGEVLQPGEYLLPAQARLTDAIQAAGGPTPAAFLFGASLRRESVRATQEVNYERALAELETQLARAAAERATRAEGAAETGNSAQQLVARLRARRPEGRVVLEVTPESTALPAVELEDGDRILLPANHQSIGVFGSVYNSGSFSHTRGRDIGHYIRRAGGPSAGADYNAVFVVRANGNVLSSSQDGSWWDRTGRFEAQPALPGDTVFVPEELFRGRWVQGFKDWTQILYQLGVGLAAIRTVR